MQSQIIGLLNFEFKDFKLTEFIKFPDFQISFFQLTTTYSNRYLNLSSSLSHLPNFWTNSLIFSSRTVNPKHWGDTHLTSLSPSLLLPPHFSSTLLPSLFENRQHNHMTFEFKSIGKKWQHNHISVDPSCIFITLANTAR